MSKKKNSNRVKLIVNPGAGNVAASAENLKFVTAYLKTAGMKVDVAFASPKKEAIPIARRAAKAGYKTVLAMGGDGTITAIIQGLAGSKTRLGVIPAGTENNIAKSLGIPLELTAACDLIITNKIIKIDLGQVKTRNGKKFIFTKNATIGLSAAVYPAANKIDNRQLTKIASAAQTFSQKETSPAVYLTLDGESKIKVETMLVMVSNTPEIGKKLPAAASASMQDGLLDISVYPEFSKSELMGYYAAVMDGGYSGDGKVQQYQAYKINIKSSPKLRIMADGVAIGKGTAAIKALPGALRIIAPQHKTPSLPSQNDIPQIKLPEPVELVTAGNHQAKNEKHGK